MRQKTLPGFNPTKEHRVPLAMNRQGLDLVETLLLPGPIFTMGFTIDKGSNRVERLGRVKNTDQSIQTKEEVYVYDWIEGSSNENDREIWNQGALRKDGVDLFRRVNTPGIYGQPSIETMFLKHTIEDNGRTRYLVLKFEIEYRVASEDDMPYETVRVQIFGCSDENDQDLCLDDLTYEALVHMYYVLLPVFTEQFSEAPIAYAALQKVIPELFPGIVSA